MTPYSATDLLRAMRHSHGLLPDASAPVESPSKAWQWIAIIFRRA